MAGTDSDGVAGVSDKELDLGLEGVSSARAVAQQAVEHARAELARCGTEALMGGRSLREVADATGYSISTVRRAKLHETRRVRGWYPSLTRPGQEQHWDGQRWSKPILFRPSQRQGGDAGAAEAAGGDAGAGPVVGAGRGGEAPARPAGLTSEAQRNAAAGKPPPEYDQAVREQQQLPGTTDRHDA